MTKTTNNTQSQFDKALLSDEQLKRRPRTIELLRAFDELNGVSGDEGAVADLLDAELKPYADEQFRDVLGNAVSVKHGSNPNLKVMLAAHMDEIGFMVNDITDRGYITVVPVGFHDVRIVVNQVMTIHTRDKGPLHGVVGAGKPIHVTYGKDKTDFSFKDVLIDIGAESAEEARSLGVRAGDFVNIEKPSHVLNERFFSGKAVDNRASCVALILLAETLANTSLAPTIYFCGTIQEEIGLKGAEVLSRRIDPDIALCFDVGFGSEQGELNENATRQYPGRGPGIELYDWSAGSSHVNVVPKRMVTALEDAAKRAGIPHQYSIMIEGGTDACMMNYANHGVLTGGISLPQKYLHTTVGIVGVDDVSGAALLAAEYLKGL